MQAQRAGRHASAGCQLEIIACAPFKAQSDLGTVLIDKAQQVTRNPESFWVKTRRSRDGIAPVPRSHVRSPKQCFKFVLTTNQLEFHAGNWNTDNTGAGGVQIAEDRRGTGLGHAKTG